MGGTVPPAENSSSGQATCAGVRDIAIAEKGSRVARSQ
jgi:hypothetical protein